MALTLAESAKYSQDALQRGVVETLVQEARILDRLPLLPVSGNAYKYNEENALPGVAFRAVNANYTESTGTLNQKSESLVILGGVAEVDRFIVQTRNDIVEPLAEQTRQKVKALNFQFNDSFINGDTAVDANSFDGLKKRLTGAQVIDAATNGLPIIGASSADRQAFFDKLDELISAVPGGPDALFMHKTIRSKILSAARRENINVVPLGQSNPDPAAFSYNGVPLVDIGNKVDQTAIIPLTETQGTATDASSIYAVRFGRDESDRAVTGLTNGGLFVENMGLVQDKPVHRIRLEIFIGVAVFGPGAARLRGVRNA